MDLHIDYLFRMFPDFSVFGHSGKLMSLIMLICIQYFLFPKCLSHFIQICCIS